MDKITEYFENNFKLAYKSVTFHFKRFVWFYLALFIVQTLLATVTFSARINENNTRETITDNYKSHCVFYYLNYTQRFYLEKSATYYFEEDHLFDVKEIEEYGNVKDYDYMCNVSIAFVDDPQEGMEKFQKRYMTGLEERGRVYLSTTPLFNLEYTAKENSRLYDFYLILLSGFSFVLLIILYNVRSNNYMFDYGIYMSFGADKKKLFNTSFWEMNVISLLTFIPSVILSLVFNAAIAKTMEIQFVFNILDCFKIILITIAVNSLAVLTIITKTAIKTPVSLISSKDNSNLVSSPRASKEMFVGRPISVLTTLSMRRYAKYYSAVTLSSVLFASLFVCGIFCANLSNQKENSENPQFAVTYNGFRSHSQSDREHYLSFDGIEYVISEAHTSAQGLMEHIVVDKSAVKPFVNAVKFDENSYAFDMVDYCAANAETVDFLKRSDHTGDLESLLNNDNTVIISDSIQNTTTFRLKPGDKIKIADFYTRIEEPDYRLQGNDLLKERLRCYFYLYEEVTVGAVIHGDCSDNMRIYLSNDMYEKVTERSADYKTAYIYTAQEADHRSILRLHKDILKLNRLQYRNSSNGVDVFVQDLYTDVYSALSANTAFGLKLSVVSISFLAVSSMIWFFSQVLFYRKRFSEFTLLRAIGMPVSGIRKILFKEAAFLALTSFVCYTALTYLLCFGVYKLMNSFLFMFTIRYSFDLSPTIFLIGGGITVLLAFASTFFNYLTYKKTNKSAVPET